MRYHKFDQVHNSYVISFSVGKANTVPVPVLVHETAGRKIVGIATETGTEIEIAIEIETGIAIAIVIVDVGQDPEIEETVTETEILIETGIAETETAIETEEGSDRLPQSHFPGQDRHLGKVLAPLECKYIIKFKKINNSTYSSLSIRIFIVRVIFISVGTMS